MDNLDKIKERIAKLLDMAKDASSPHEAAIAAQRARSLMDKHQLDEFDVNGADKKYEFGATYATDESRKVPYHHNVLSVAVAKYNDCISEFTFSGRAKAIIFYGYKQDTELAKQLFDYLVECVERFAADYKRQGGTGTKAVFIRGMCGVLITRLEQIGIERDQLTCASTGTALVAYKAQLVAQEFGDPNYSKTRGIRIDGDNTDAYVKGRAAGMQVQIVKSVE